MLQNVSETNFFLLLSYYGLTYLCQVKLFWKKSSIAKLVGYVTKQWQVRYKQSVQSANSGWIPLAKYLHNDTGRTLYTFSVTCTLGLSMQVLDDRIGLLCIMCNLIYYIISGFARIKSTLYSHMTTGGVCFFFFYKQIISNIIRHITTPPIISYSKQNFKGGVQGTVLACLGPFVVSKCKKLLKTHTKLLRKTWLNTLVAVARGQGPFAYEKILYLIGLKYAISFPFGQKPKTRFEIYWDKTWSSFFCGGCKG